MVRFLLFAIFLRMASIDLKSQSLELSTLLNLSNEKRFDKASGIGMMYSHNISMEESLGLSICYKFNHSKYDKITRPDFDPQIFEFARIDSKSKSISIRINYQYSFINRDQVRLSIGPEISYNFLWGADNNQYSYSGDSIFWSSSQKNEMIKKIGVGLLAEVEINKIFTDNLALCISLRPESLISGRYLGGEKPYSGVIGNAEFVIGFKYKLK